MLRGQNHTNTNQFSRKIGWDVALEAVDNTKLWRDCVSNKEIAYGKEKKGKAKTENLWNGRKREREKERERVSEREREYTS